MQPDLSRRHWLGMAAVCAITMAAGIARTRLAQDSLKPHVRHAFSENGEDGPVPETLDRHPGGGDPR